MKIIDSDSESICKIPESLFAQDILIIGDQSLPKMAKHFSFGRIVLLETYDIADEDAYEFMQNVLRQDFKLHLDGVMTRTSPSKSQINLKVSKAAVNAGFSFQIMAETIRGHFMEMSGVKNVKVILIIGESDLYKKLLEVAEKQGEITKALNHIFDGIPMDCGRCDMKEVCDEVDGLRRLHKFG